MFVCSRAGLSTSLWVDDDDDDDDVDGRFRTQQFVTSSLDSVVRNTLTDDVTVSRAEFQTRRDYDLVTDTPARLYSVSMVIETPSVTSTSSANEQVTAVQVSQTESVQPEVETVTYSEETEDVFNTVMRETSETVNRKHKQV